MYESKAVEALLSKIIINFYLNKIEKNMKKNYLWLISLAAAMTACGGGGTTTYSPYNSNWVSCKVNATGTFTNLSSQPYINNSTLSFAPDPAEIILRSFESTASLYNSLVFTFDTEAGRANTLSYKVANKSSEKKVDGYREIELYFSFTDIPTGSSCNYRGTYRYTYMNGTEPIYMSTTATLSNCSSNIPQSGQSYTFNATYNINAKDSFPALSGTLTFSCTPN